LQAIFSEMAIFRFDAELALPTPSGHELDTRLALAEFADDEGGHAVFFE
jgi:hypothetical protein